MGIKNEWETVKLKDIIKIEKNSVLPNNLNGEDIYLGLDDIEKDTGIIKSLKYVKECDVKSNKFKFTSNHILYGKLRPNLNKVALPNFNGICSTDIFPIIIQEGKTVKEYIYHILHGQDFVKYASSRTNGANLPRVNSNTILDYEILLPPLETQKQIAKKLDTAAELIAMRKRQLTELDNLIKSTFYDMFGDPVENEKGWLVSPLREELNVKHGFAFQGEYFSNEGEYILLTPGNFYEEGGYRNRGDKQKYYRGKIPQEYILNKDDLLIAMTEQAPGLLGSPLIVPESNKFLHNQRLGLIVLKKYDISKLYIFHLFNHQNIRKLIHLQATGTKVRHTSPKKIENLMVPLPPTELQTHFANVVTKIEEKKALVKKAIDETQYLFDSLMSEYFE
ncbi:restriction endonuclease subunit S [Paenibacillus urinalis]|uniref:restriction endonuclease subunit S n=1 Tax=Paenibacillus urinalis TaxID=521520 RepID=UPI00195F2D47